MSENNYLQMNTYMQELKSIAIDEQKACEVFDNEISALQDRLKSIMEKRESISQPFTEKADSMKEKIKCLALIMAKSYKNDCGNVNYRKGYERRSYDAKALDNLCISDIHLKEMLYPYRKVTNIEPNVSIILDGF